MNVFDINSATNKIDGEIFVAAKVSQEIEEKTLENNEKMQKIEHKSSQSIVKMFAIIFGFAALISVVTILNEVFKTGSFERILRNGGFSIILAIVSIILCGTLFIFARFRTKKVVESDEAADMMSENIELM